MPYDHKDIEKKWQKFWQEKSIYRAQYSPKNPEDNSGTGTSEQRKKKYILDMFPYPSGAGLHVGHPKGYTATDIVSRYYHAQGYNVLHTMGWDAFGLPAENYAIKTGTHPSITTAENIATFRSQMESLGFSYDWDREIDTTDPEYYRWTQWIFLELFRRGLAYEQDLPINYCPSCKTGLANEEVLADNSCDRCGTKVERRPIRQWVLKITEYAERLIDDLEGLDWPLGVKEMQRNWIGKSDGCEFRMMKKVEGKPLALLLHGWEGKADSNWFMSAKQSLEQLGYDVVVPDLPHSDIPNLEEQLTFLSQFVPHLDEQSIVIGHSLGGQLAAKFVESLTIHIQALVMVAPTYPGVADDMSITEKVLNDREKAFSLYTRQEANFEKISQNSSLQILHISENDPYIHFGNVQKYYRSLNRIQIHTYGDKGHFNERDGITSFPEILTFFDSISVYTTRVDTVFGMTYAVMAPDHPHVHDFITSEQKQVCEAYIEASKNKSDQDRTADNKEKTGVFTGSFVINPYNQESVPLWIADYVLGHYGTGAVMAVPAHDERDGAFAKKYNLPIKQSIAPILGTPRDDSFRRDFVKALIIKDGKILVFKFNKFENLYDLPGGGIDEGEDIFTAMAREIREETGFENFTIKSCTGQYKMYHHTPVRNVQREALATFFLVELSDDFQSERRLEELEDFSWEWLSVDEALEKFKDIEIHKHFAFAIRHAFFRHPLVDDGILVNSREFNGLTSTEARKILTEKAEIEGFGHKKIHYKLRDWLFSRQRYWGEPIPLIHLAIEDVKKLPHITDISQATDMTLAYILKREPLKGEQNIGAMCHGKVRELIIGGTVFSKIYDGINSKIIIDARLPLTLPAVEKYEPAGDGQSPLASVSDWVNIKLADNLSGKRETNTMPQWGGSCWYYLRFMDPKNPKALASKETLEYWKNVDEYVGGAEHAVLHLLYARFWHKVLYDAEIVPTKEPFQKLTNVGMILAYAYERDDGGLVAVDLVEEKEGKYFEVSTGAEVKQVVAKMSKSLKNVVNPNDIVAEYGADTLRLYEMSMSAFTDTAPWNPEAIIGVRRFLDRTYSAFTEANFPDEKTEKDKKNEPLRMSTFFAKDDIKTMKLLHKTVKKVGEDIVEYKFNTAISALIILLNEGIPHDRELAHEWKEKFVVMLHPFAPHMAEELWSILRQKNISLADTATHPEKKSLSPSEVAFQSVYHATWPEYNAFMLIDDEVTIAVQVNGKLRGTFSFLHGVTQEEVSERVRAEESIRKWIDGREIQKEIFIPNKMLSIVVSENISL